MCHRCHTSQYLRHTERVPQVSLLLQLNVSHVDEETIVWPPLATVLLLEVRAL